MDALRDQHYLLELEPFSWLEELSMASRDHCDEIGEDMHERVNHYI